MVDIWCMYSRTLLDILFLIWGQTVADYKMLSFHLSINVIIIVVSFKILDLCPNALFQQLWNTLYNVCTLAWRFVCLNAFYWKMNTCGSNADRTIFCLKDACFLDLRRQRVYCLTGKTCGIQPCKAGFALNFADSLFWRTHYFSLNDPVLVGDNYCISNLPLSWMFIRTCTNQAPDSDWNDLEIIIRSSAIFPQ